MGDDFSAAVEDGLKLSKRIYGGKDRVATPPRPAGDMDRASPSLLPTAPMAYAVIGDPAIVDNPDIPSYQPHVYGRCDPPALIPLHMKGISLQVECYLDMAVVSVTAQWRLHCVMASRSTDCRIAIPMGEQGSILGVEVGVSGRSYHTQVIQRDEDENTGKITKNQGGGYLKPQIFFLTVPQVAGGCDISLKASWSQKLIYKDGVLSISTPFTFPDYVNPFTKIPPIREKIQLNVNSGTAKEVLCLRTSHPLKEKGRHVGKLAFFYEEAVENWSKKDFFFSYSVYSNDLFGGILSQSPTMYDHGPSDMLCLYLFPGNNLSRKAFRKEVVFIVDNSGSMQGKPISSVKSTLCTALLELSPGDCFNIIAFNEETCLFSPSLELVSEDMIENATQWMNKNFVTEGGTNIMHPLNEAMRLLSNTKDALPHIYLITDGAVEDEENICSTMSTHIKSRGFMSPRIFTFGIGLFCNHYFLRKLASLSRAHYDAAYDSGSIASRMLGWLRKASSPIVADIDINFSDHLDAVEVYPSSLPDLSTGCPLVISGRFQGKFPDLLKAKGRLADMSDIVIDLKVQHAKDIPLEKVFAKQQIDLLTAEAWFSKSKQQEEKVIKLSTYNGIASEYTYMVQSETEKQEEIEQMKGQKLDKHKGTIKLMPMVVQGLNIGFGNRTATVENLPPGFGEHKLAESSDIFVKAVGCCNSLCDCFFCMCCIRCCSKMNDQCVLALTQLCVALSCFACFECCAELCCDNSD